MNACNLSNLAPCFRIKSSLDVGSYKAFLTSLEADVLALTSSAFNSTAPGCLALNSASKEFACLTLACCAFVTLVPLLIVTL